jgi:hypothetical protein
MPTPKPHFVVGKSAFVCGNRFQECRIGPGHVRERCLNLLDHSIPPDAILPWKEVAIALPSM